MIPACCIVFHRCMQDFATRFWPTSGIPNPLLLTWVIASTLSFNPFEFPFSLATVEPFDTFVPECAIERSATDLELIADTQTNIFEGEPCKNQSPT